jgi:hypothetical protein
MFTMASLEEIRVYNPKQLRLVSMRVDMNQKFKKNILSGGGENDA